MWYAEKIELTKNSDREPSDWDLCLRDCYTLKINDEIIYNAVKNSLPTFFETWVCGYCGCEGCNGAPTLMLRKAGDRLLFLPDFDIMDSFEEYNSDTMEGERERPPHKWYEDGILIVEGDQLRKLYELLPGLTNEKISEATPEEIDKMALWEKMVLEKPKGFMLEEELSTK